MPEGCTAPVSAGARRNGREFLTTGEMARLAKSTLRTVRFYEETGVLEPAGRSEGGHRLFAATELDKLLFVADLRGAGLSLDEIKAMLAAKHACASGATAAEHVSEMLSRHVEAMRAKIAMLTRLHDDFTRAATTLAPCRDCHNDPRFPNACGACSAMQGDATQADLPRTLRVLWRVARAGGPDEGAK